MTIPLLSLSALTLLICAGVASLPALVRPSEPRLAPVSRAAPRNEFWVVQAPGERWFLNGTAISREQLRALLHSAGRSSLIHALPSAALTTGEIRRGLGWLRQGNAVVSLELQGWR